MKKCRRLASFVMLSTSRNEEVTQNCCVFDVVKFEKRGSHAELLRFLILTTLKNEEVSQNTSVFKVADRRVDRLADRQTREREREIDR